MGKNKGYNSWANVHAYDHVKNVSLPEKLKCDKCDKWKGHQNFAAKRLNDARLKVHQRKTFSISCKQCVGTQIVEIECTRCSETKGLEEYAKSQRKPDTAVCMACMEKQLELDPISGRQYEDNRDAFMLPEKTEWPDYWNPEAGSSRATDHATEHATDTSSTGGVSLNESMSHLKLSSKMGPAFSAANGADPSWKSSKSQSLLIDVSDDTAPTAATAGSSATTGFNPNKYGNPCSQSVGSSKTWSTNVPGAHSVKPVGKSGWAKIPAYKPPPKPELFDEESKHSDDEKDDWKSASDDDSDGTVEGVL